MEDSHHRRRSSVEGENDWAFDYVMSYMKTPEWDSIVMGFVDDNCWTFGNFMNDKEEISFEEYNVYQEFQKKIDSLLSKYLEQVSLDVESFISICGEEMKSINSYETMQEDTKYEELGNNNLKSGFTEGERKEDNSHVGGRKEKKARSINKEVLAQLFAMSDFKVFRKLMIKRNMEIEMEALEQIEKDWDEDIEKQMRKQRHNTRSSMDTSFDPSEFTSEYVLKRRDSIKKAEEKYESTRNRLEDSESEGDEKMHENGEEDNAHRGNKDGKKKSSGLSLLSMSKWNPFGSLGDIQKEEKQVGQELEKADYELAVALACSMEEIALARSMEENYKKPTNGVDVISRFKEARLEEDNTKNVAKLNKESLQNTKSKELSPSLVNVGQVNTKESPSKTKSTLAVEEAQLSARFRSFIENNPTAIKDNANSVENIDEIKTVQTESPLQYSKLTVKEEADLETSERKEGSNESNNVSSIGESLAIDDELVNSSKITNSKETLKPTLTLSDKSGKKWKDAESVLPPIQFPGEQEGTSSLNSMKQLPALSKSKGIFSKSMNPFYVEVREEKKEKEEIQQETKNDNENLTDQALEMERRREYLKKQRDIIVAKKKAEREKRLRQYNDEKQKQGNLDFDEDKVPINVSPANFDSEHEERLSRAQKEKERAFLVRKIKQEVVDSDSF